MGNPLYSDEIGMMCFNAAKNFQIDGWYNDAKITHDPINEGTWTGQIIGIGEYDLRTNQPVTIKIETGTSSDYFVGFNRAVGPNVQNDLGDNMVNIIKTGNNGIGYSQSYLEMLLDATPAHSEHNIPNFAGTGNSLMIKVNSIDTIVVPGYASVTIGFPGAPTLAPINQPTLSPFDPPTSTPVTPPTYAPVQTTLAPVTSPTSAPVQPTSAPVQTTLAPVTSPTSAPIQPTSAPVDGPTGQCGPEEAEVKLTIKTDYWGYETSWRFLTGTNIIKSRRTKYYGKQQPISSLYVCCFP